MTLKKIAKAQPNKHAAALAAWSLAAVIVGAVAGARLDEALRQVLVLSGFFPSSWASDNLLTFSANVTVGLITAVVAFLVAWKQAIPRLPGNFLNTVATATRQEDGARQYKAIVSTLSLADREKAELLAAFVETEIAKGTDRRTLLANMCSTNEATAGFAHRLTWQQTLRMVQFHWPRLQVLHFVLSPQVKDQFPVFLRIVTPLLPPGVTVMPDLNSDLFPCSVVDSTDYNAVSDCIKQVCEAATLKAGCDHRDLCIDITAGQKIWSAAGTIATLNSDAAFGYVDTHDANNAGKMVVFNARIVSDGAGK